MNTIPRITGASSDNAKVSKKAGEGGGKSNRPAKLRQPKKSDLGPHPYLAADLKGHTESVLSLDFEPGGKYLVSCSEGGKYLNKEGTYQLLHVYYMYAPTLLHVLLVVHNIRICRIK